MPTWPATLPQAPLADGYHEGGPGGLLVREPDAGPPEVRRRSTAGRQPIAAQYAVTAAQLATFELFVRDDLAGGALAFDWPHPRLGPVSVRIAVSAGEPPYQIRPRARGLHYTVSLTLWMLP